MNEVQYEVIKAIIHNGAPALSKELLGALDAEIQSGREAKTQLEELEKKDEENKKV